MNAQNRSDSYLLPEDGQKMTYEKDTKIPNAGMFTLLREDHTMANLLRMQLLQDESVTFAGYKHPHPLVHDVLIRVQTNDTTTPIDALSSSIKSSMEEFDTFTNNFKVRSLCEYIYILPCIFINHDPLIDIGQCGSISTKSR